MAGVKVFLRTNKKKADGTCPIVMRITNNRSSIEKFLGHSVKEEDWNEENSTVKKAHKNSVRINHLILKKKMEISAIILDAENSDAHLTKKQIKQKVKHPNKSSFNSVAQEHLDDLLKLKKFNQLSGEQPRVNHFKSFLDNEDISFQHITPSLLKKFMIYLKADKGLSDRSVMNCLIVIRTLFNKAIADSSVENKYYPFGPGKIQIRIPESHKVGLNPDEIRMFEEEDLSLNKNRHNARNIWLTSFYLAGVRAADVIGLKWTDIQDGRLKYIMDKNGKAVSLKLPEKANAIIESYRGTSEESYVFPYLKDEYELDDKIFHTKTRSFNSMINKELKALKSSLKIDKNVSMHISRHSFGQIAGDKISAQDLQKLYRHSDLKTTIGYQSNFIHKDVDDALSSVLNF